MGICILNYFIKVWLNNSDPKGDNALISEQGNKLVTYRL